jgi:MFS family permease
VELTSEEVLISPSSQAVGIRVPWRQLSPTVLIPNLLHGAGQGAVVPAIPIAAMEFGASYASAAVTAAMLPVGQLLFALPSGSLVSRYSEKSVMLAAVITTLAGGVCAFLAPSLPVLMASSFLMGSGVAVFQMARHAWITVAVPVEVRGRSLALVASFNRLGMFLGPFMAAAALWLADDTRSAFVVIIATDVVLFALVACVRFPRGVTDAAPAAAKNGEAPGVFATLWENRGVLLRLGTVTSILGTVRMTRKIFVPLIGVALGMDAVAVAVLVGVAAGVDFALTYVGGIIIDRWGRMWVAVPPMAIFGLTHIVMAVAGYLPAGQIWFISAALLMAAGNGISAGVVATMGSDLADPHNPGPFLGSWRLITDFTPSLAPLAISALVAVSSLSIACAAAGLMALFGAALLPRYIRRYLPMT